jgi:hypothetical protein
MEPSRRAFLGLSAAALAAVALDPERLLWRPGARTIFLPSPSQVRYYLCEPNQWGRIVRGRRLREAEYRRLISSAIVWRDDTAGTVITLTDRSGWIVSPDHAARVESLDLGRGFRFREVR